MYKRQGDGRYFHMCTCECLCLYCLCLVYLTKNANILCTAFITYIVVVVYGLGCKECKAFSPLKIAAYILYDVDDDYAGYLSYLCLLLSLLTLIYVNKLK